MNEGKPRRRAVGWAVIIGGVLIAAAIIALYTPWLRLFDLQEIVVRGNYYTSTQEIKERAGFVVGSNVFRAPIDRARARLVELPWVKSVSIHRVFPHTIEIKVLERAPIVTLVDPSNPSRILLIGEDGVIIGDADSNYKPLLSITGAPISGDNPGERIVDTGITQTLAYLYETGLTTSLFQRIDFSNPDMITMNTKDGVEVVLGAVDGISSRIDELNALLKTLDLAAYQRIDLSFGGEAILVPRKVVNR